MMEWQPIEKLPINRAWWLVWDSAVSRPVVCEKRADDGTLWEGDWDFEVKATHFIDLEGPPPPPGETK